MIVICDRCKKQSRAAYKKPDGQTVPSEAVIWLSLYNPRDRERYFLCPECEKAFDLFVATDISD